MIATAKLPWNERSGRFSPLKAFCLVVVLAPIAVLAWRALVGSLGTGAAGPLGPRPITEAIHFTGDWAIRFLLASLAVTPLRRIANFSRLILVRRQLGLAALFYVLTHLLLYAMDQKWDFAKVVSEIALRYYLTIGFLALAGLIVLGLTSTDAMIRRMGKRWNELHKLVYLISVLAILHYFMQSKADVFQPTLMAGFFIYLMIWRFAQKRGANEASVATLSFIAIAAALLTVGVEYSWYALATNIPASKVLAANLSFSFSIRPAWWVLLVGAVLALLSLARQNFTGGTARKSHTAIRHAAS